MQLFRKKSPKPKVQGVLPPENPAESHWRVINLFKGILVPRKEPTEPETPQANAQEVGQNQPAQQENSQVVGASVNHVTIPLGNACHAIPTMSIPDDSANLWEISVREPLINELKKCFRTVRCEQPELFMVSDAAGNLGPCIILSVWNDKCETEYGKKKVAKEATKTVRRFQIMQTCPFPVLVIADKISLSSSWLKAGQLTVTAVNTSLENRQSLMSLEISVGTDQRQRFRLGGLVRVGSKVYGLTVAHPLRPSPNNGETPLELGEETQEPDEMDDSAAGESDGILFKPNHTVGEMPSAPDLDFHQNSAFPNGTRSTHTFLPDSMVGGNRSSARISQIDFPNKTIGQVATLNDQSSMHPSGASDWALVELDPTIQLPPNLYHQRFTGQATRITAVYPQIAAPGTEVIVLAEPNNHYHLRGVVGQSNVTLAIDGWHLRTTQVVIDEPLGPGYSGSWVVKDNFFVGIVVAIRKVLPIIYIMPASMVLENISLVLREPMVGIAEELSTSNPSAEINREASRGLSDLGSSPREGRLEARQDSLHDFEENDIGIDGTTPAPEGGSASASIPSTLAGAIPATVFKLDPPMMMAPELSIFSGSPSTAVNTPRTPSTDNSQLKKPVKAKSALRPSMARVDDDFYTREYTATSSIPHRSNRTGAVQGLASAADRSEVVLPPPPLSSTVSHSDELSSRVSTRAPVEIPSPGDSLAASPTTGSLDPIDEQSKIDGITAAIFYFQAFLSTFAASMPAPALSKIASDLSISSNIESQMVLSVFLLGCLAGPLIKRPLSDTYGPYNIVLLSLFLFSGFNLGCGFSTSKTMLILFRGLAGIGAVAPFDVERIIIDRLIKRENIGTAMKLLAGAPLHGLALGPVIGALITQWKSWRWPFWIVSIGTIVSFLGLLASRYALRGFQLAFFQARNHRRHTRFEVGMESRARKRQSPRQFYLWMVRLAFDMPRLALLALSGSLAYGIQLFVLSILGEVLRERYRLSMVTSGLSYLSFLGAFWVTPIVQLYWGNVIEWEKTGHVAVWLYKMLGLFSGLIVYGWAVQERLPVAIAIIALVAFSWGATGVVQLVNISLINVYGHSAPAAVADVTALRYLFGFAYPLFAPSLIRRIGYGWSSTALAILTLFVGVIPARFQTPYDKGPRGRGGPAHSIDLASAYFERPPGVSFYPEESAAEMETMSIRPHDREDTILPPELRKEAAWYLGTAFSL